MVVVATGGKPYEPTQYLYGKSEQVLTQGELEERLTRVEEAKEINDVVMIQCVGSRGEDLSYCSRPCCNRKDPPHGRIFPIAARSAADRP